MSNDDSKRDYFRRRMINTEIFIFINCDYKIKAINCRYCRHYKRSYYYTGI